MVRHLGWSAPLPKTADPELDTDSVNAIKSIAECSACIKLPFVFKNFILSIFEWPLKTGLTVNVILVFIVSSSNESSDN